MNVFLKLASTAVFASFFLMQSQAQKPIIDKNNWAYDAIQIPLSKDADLGEKPVVVAVIDDAFRLSHKELKDFIYKNPLETAANQLDDDGNGYKDDVYGWDISDNDNDVSVIEGRSHVFLHGTYISSLISRVATLHYGQKASDRIKIMPVKVLSDHASKTYLLDGYRGIKYAIENGADLICIAWSGGDPGEEELNLIREARQKGILIISSVGNFNEQNILNPAKVPEVLAVTGIDRGLKKYEYSNYGAEADISAPAIAVKGAHPEKDNAYFQMDGTSASAGLVAGCAAVILSKRKGLSPTELKEILLNSSTTFDHQFTRYGGKMGSGIINLENALRYLNNYQEREQLYSSLRPKGTIIVDVHTTMHSWEISPAGSYHGFYLHPDFSMIKKPEKHILQISVGDTLWNAYPVDELPQQLFIPSPSVRLDLENSKFRKNDLIKLPYQGWPVDSTTLYCSDTKYINVGPGILEDGSSQNQYASNCSCKWIITAPQGKRVRFTFQKMDTQANVDFVYLVDGRTAIPENFIAKFSGQNLPPIVSSRTNEVLVWFVTNSSHTGQGWQFRYEFIE